MKEIKEIAEEYSIKDLGRVSPAYQLGFTQGAKWAKGELITKVYHADMLYEEPPVETMKRK